MATHTLDQEEEDEKNADSIVVDDGTGASSAKQRIAECVHYDELYCHQKILYYILYPVCWALDLSVISRRDWIQIPMITYAIEITRLMIAITFVEAHIQGLEVRATKHRIASTTVAIYLLVYTLITAAVCITLLYFLRRFTTSLHYKYFVDLSTCLIAYGWLYWSVLVQYQWFRDSPMDAWSWFLYVFLYATLTIALLILIKQFVFKLHITQNLIKQYNTYSSLMQISPSNMHEINGAGITHAQQQAHDQVESELVSLMSSDRRSNVDEDETKREEFKFLFDEASMSEVYDISDSFWYTVFVILQSMWSSALGFLLVECVVYMFINDYVNLLTRWQQFRHRSSILDNQWQIVMFGLGLAVFTCLLEGFLELNCKIPWYRLVAQNEDYKDCFHRFVVFLLNWINDVSLLWFEVLSVCIGWSLLTPNQARSTWHQLESAVIATVVFVLVGLALTKWKNNKVRKIMRKMEDIRNEESGDEQVKRSKLLNNVRNLMFYNKLVKMFDAAFAVSVSFAWESFIDLATKDTSTSIAGDDEAYWIELIITIVYAVFIGVAFTELGLMLTDLRTQRLRELKQRRPSAV